MKIILKDATDKEYQRRLEACNETSRAMLVELLYEMAISLGYEFDKVHLKRGVYQPQGHNWIELEQNIIRGGLAQVFAGNKAFPVYVSDSIAQSSDAKQKEEIQKE